MRRWKEIGRYEIEITWPILADEDRMMVRISEPMDRNAVPLLMGMTVRQARAFALEILDVVADVIPKE